MKKVYSVLSTVALLFSLPAMATSMAEKSSEPRGNEKETRESPKSDKIFIDKGPKKEASSPLCRVGGG